MSIISYFAEPRGDVNGLKLLWLADGLARAELKLALSLLLFHAGAAEIISN